MFKFSLAISKAFETSVYCPLGNPKSELAEIIIARIKISEHVLQEKWISYYFNANVII